MRSRLSILAVLSILTLIATACGAQTPPAFVVSSTPVAGYGGTPLPTGTTSAAIPATGSTATMAAAPAATSMATSAPASGGGGYGGGGYGSGGSTSATMAAPAAGASGAAQVAVGNNATLGSILVDGAGRTLYVLTKDTPNTPTCYAGCAGIWPAFLVSSGSPAASTGVDASKFGSAVRTDGGTQVTYNGWPLYYYSGDANPGDVNGQGIGGVWFVVSPQGDPMK